jgi:hypothetical protein
LILYDSQVDRSSGHGQHGGNKNFPGQDMTGGTFAKREGGGAGKQT